MEATKPAASVALPAGRAAMAAVPAAEPAVQALAAVDAQVVTSLELTERNVEEPTQAEITAVLGTKADALEKLGELEASEPELWTREQKLLVETVNEEIQALNQSRIEAVTFAASMVEYPAALGTGTTLRYMVSPGKLKEEIVLESADTLESYQVTMDTDGLTAVADPDGGIRLCDGEGTAIFTIAPPLLYDAADETSRDVEVTVEQSGDECVLTYTPDREWITDPARVWPVVIDPTVTSAAVAQQQQIDNYVYHGQTSPMNSSADKLYIGQYSRNGSLREHGAYWRLNTLPTLPSGANITGASLHFRLSNGTSSMGSIEVWTAETSWDSTTLTWSNKPAPETFLGDIDSLPSGSAKWLVYDSVWVKEAVIDWYASPANNHGVLLWHGLCIDDYNTIYSSDYRPSGSTAYIPYLAVSYADTVPVSQICLSTSSWTLDLDGTFKLSADVLPSNASNRLVYYSSDNESVATVNQAGQVTAKGAGTAVITARSASNSSIYATCSVKVLHPDPFHPTNIEYLRIKKYDQSSMGGDSDITTIVTKSLLESDEYFECFAPGRAQVAFKINADLKNYLKQQEASFQSYPTAILSNFYYHLAKLGVDDMVSRGIIGFETAEYYGIWASESTRLLIEAKKAADTVNLVCAVITAGYTIYNVVSSIRSFQLSYNTTTTINNAQYLSTYRLTRDNYLKGGTGYSTFEQAKNALGDPGTKKAWHHIVEQNQIENSRFKATDVHNSKNLVAVESGFSGSIHQKISGHYSKKLEFTGGLTVRQWLTGQSFEAQFEYGLSVLSEYGTIRPTETGWIFTPY